MPVTLRSRIMRYREHKNQIRFIGINERIGKHLQRPFAGFELVRVTQQWIASDEFFRLCEFFLKTYAQTRFVRFIPVKRLDDVKLRAGMIFDDL